MPTVSHKVFFFPLETFHVKISKGVMIHMFLLKLNFYPFQLFFIKREFQVVLPLNFTEFLHQLKCTFTFYSNCMNLPIIDSSYY